MKKVSLLLWCCIVLGYARVNPFILPGESPPHPVTPYASSTGARSIQSAQSSSIANDPLLLRKIEYRFGTILVYPDFLIIQTPDRLKRSFVLDSPKKIVLDFIKKSDFPSKRIVLEHPLFHQIQLGAHSSFYRMAISVSKDCRVDLQRGENYRISCL